MKKLLLGLLIGLTLASAGGLYYDISFSLWSDTHKPSQGMPETLDLKVARALNNYILFVAEELE